MDNQEKIQELSDELYVLHNEARKRMTKLTEENKKSAQLLHNIQHNMEICVNKELEKEDHEYQYEDNQQKYRYHDKA